MALTLVASTDVVELICFDYPNLDIKKAIYGYDEEARRVASWRLDEAMMRLPELLVLTWLKACDHQLSVEKILAFEVDENPAFKDLDKEGTVCSLALSTEASHGVSRCLNSLRTSIYFFSLWLGMLVMEQP